MVAVGLSLLIASALRLGRRGNQTAGSEREARELLDSLRSELMRGHRACMAAGGARAGDAGLRMRWLLQPAPGGVDATIIVEHAGPGADTLLDFFSC